MPQKPFRCGLSATSHCLITDVCRNPCDARRREALVCDTERSHNAAMKRRNSHCAAELRGSGLLKTRCRNQLCRNLDTTVFEQFRSCSLIALYAIGHQEIPGQRRFRGPHGRAGVMMSRGALVAEIRHKNARSGNESGSGRGLTRFTLIALSAIRVITT